jgi:hypothetical protein
MFSYKYRNYALRMLLDIPLDAEIPPAAIEVWERFNDRRLAQNALHNRRMAKTRAHVVKLEAKLAERRDEFVQTFVIGLIISHDKRFIMAQEREGQLFFPGTKAEEHETAGEAFALILNAVGVITAAPRELAVQREEQHGVNLRTVFMGGFQQKGGKLADYPNAVGWFNIGDTRFSEVERRLIQSLQES